MTASPFSIAILLLPSAVLIEMLPDIATCSLWSQITLVGDHCSESYHLEQLVISEIGNQLGLVITACIPTVSNHIA